MSVAYTIYALDDWSPEVLFGTYVDTGRHMLFMSTNLENNSTQQIRSDHSNPANWILFLFACCSRFILSIQYVTILVALGISAITMWNATTTFANVIAKEKFKEDDEMRMFRTRGMNIKYFLTKYKELRNLVQSINAVWSGLIFWLTLDACLWMSSDFDRALKSTSYYFMISNFSLNVCSFAAFLLSAECSKKVSPDSVLRIFFYVIW